MNDAPFLIVNPQMLTKHWISQMLQAGGQWRVSDCIEQNA